MKSTITKEQLLEWGMINTIDPSTPLKKVLGESEEIGELSIILTLHRNVQEFAISLPDGAMLMLNPLTIEDLKKIEEMLMSYEPVW